MKAKITCCLFLLTTILFSQSGINYKALITDASGNPLLNTAVVVQFGIHEDFDGIQVYSESHNTTSDANGNVIVTIGQGTPLFGSFDNIFLSPNSTALNVQIDTGDGLVDFGFTEFNYVPYASVSYTHLTLPTTPYV